MRLLMQFRIEIIPMQLNGILTRVHLNKKLFLDLKTTMRLQSRVAGSWNKQMNNRYEYDREELATELPLQELEITSADTIPCPPPFTVEELETLIPQWNRPGTSRGTILS